MNDEPATEKEGASRAQLVGEARRRGIAALAGTLVIATLGFLFFRSCHSLPGETMCRVGSDCEGVIGAECLHAPTQTYCTHTCTTDDDCDEGLRCESPPWEQGATRTLCLRPPPPAK